MKNYFLAIFGLVLFVNGVIAEEQTVKWNSLFNSTNLNGWVKLNDGVFTATNGAIHIEGGKGWLRTERVFTNFVLEVEWRGLETNYNSGIFVRAPIDGKPWVTNVWQINLKQSAIGELLEGSNKIVPVSARKLPACDWVKFRIEARGRELTLEVNGQLAWKYSKFTPTSGHLGLQAEGKTFEFRNLTVIDLP